MHVQELNHEHLNKLVCEITGINGDYLNNWAFTGELIEKFRLALSPLIDGSWGVSFSIDDKPKHYFERNKIRGLTPQEAICRAVVASVYGDSVEDASGGK